MDSPGLSLNMKKTTSISFMFKHKETPIKTLVLLPYD